MGNLNGITLCISKKEDLVPITVRVWIPKLHIKHFIIANIIIIKENGSKLAL